MADVSGRDKLERALARAISKVFGSLSNDIMRALGSPPDISKITPEFWDKFGMELSAELSPFLEKVYLQQALTVMNETGIAIDWTLANQAAIDWANSYSFELVSFMRDGNQNLLRSAVSSHFEQGWTLDQLEERIVRAFGPTRAEMIARTEVTRAASEGQLLVAQEIEKEGVIMAHIWHTKNDEIVCVICGPRNDKEIGKEIPKEYPPAHPRCRCWWGLEIPK